MNKFLTLLIILLFPTTSFGGVSLGWDASPSDQVVGYRIYIGTTSRIYSRMDQVGNVLLYTVNNLTPGIKYYFAATAYDVLGTESDYSNEVSTTAISCDLNSDNSTDILDLQSLTLQVVTGQFNPLYDLNKDGSLSVLDVQFLSNVILGQQKCQ